VAAASIAPVCCDECGEEFPSFSAYTIHLQLADCRRFKKRPDGLYTCPYCNMNLPTLPGLKTHIALVVIILLNYRVSVPVPLISKTLSKMYVYKMILIRWTLRYCYFLFFKLIKYPPRYGIKVSAVKFESV
jgi:hypothetical protein